MNETKDKEKILKAARSKRCIIYRGIIRILTDFSSETMKSRKTMEIKAQKVQKNILRELSAGRTVL